MTIDRVEWNLYMDSMGDLISEKDIWSAIRKIKNKKAVRLDEVEV